MTTTTRRPTATPRTAARDDAALLTNRASATNSRPRRCPARCRSGRTRRSARRTDSTRSSCRARRSPRRASANRRTWTYRIRPAAMHEPFRQIGNGRIESRFGDVPTPPNQLRWDPLPMPDRADRLRRRPRHDGGQRRPGGDERAAASTSTRPTARCTDRFFYDADGELLIVPQQGRLRVATELGRHRRRAAGDRRDPARRALPRRAARRRRARLRLRELRRAVPAARPRRHRLQRPRQSARLPDAASPRTRIAKASSSSSPSSWATCGRRAIGHSPLDVVAWHGNYAPYKYDLRRFNTIGSISYDHPDPSIFLVLQSQSDTPGVDTIDFVIFPPRILAMEHTFRPPWFHRNVASEFMGLIHGVYDAKAEGFLPGGASLHNCMTGPRAGRGDVREGQRRPTCRSPRASRDTMAFMFETRARDPATRRALESAQLQPEYFRCWQGLRKHFDPARP